MTRSTFPDSGSAKYILANPGAGMLKMQNCLLYFGQYNSVILDHLPLVTLTYVCRNLETPGNDNVDYESCLVLLDYYISMTSDPNTD